jgi:hypothetical protein
VAASEEEARALVLRVLEGRLATTERDLACWKAGIALLRLP